MFKGEKILKHKSDLVRTTPAGLAEERFGGFHCCCNILLPAWSRNSGV